MPCAHRLLISIRCLFDDETVSIRNENSSAELKEYDT